MLLTGHFRPRAQGRLDATGTVLHPSENSEKNTAQSPYPDRVNERARSPLLSPASVVPCHRLLPCRTRGPLVYIG